MNARKNFTIIGTAILLLAVFVVPVLAVTISDINFEIDGNTASNGADDWETVILGGSPSWDAGPATLIQDGNSGPKSLLVEQSIFATGGKFANPAGWNVQPGNVPAQNDLTNVYVGAYGSGDSVSGDSWITMGMHRIKKQGTFDLDFEFNQVAWDGTSGTLVRTEGDIVVGFELSGNPSGPNDLQVLILYYKPADTNCSSEPFFTGTIYGAGFCEVFRGQASALSTFGVATMNEFAFNRPPWGAFDSDGSVLAANEQIQPFFFAEAAINLSELGIDLACPGFGSVHAKSRSSLEVTADLKDLAGPVDFAVSCYIDGYKFHDQNANGSWDKPGEPGLEGWTIDLYKSGVLVDSTTTDATGYYKFDQLSDGTYSVKEVCPAAWNQSYPGPNPAAACGDNTHTFVVNTSDPIHAGDFGNYQNGTKSGMKYKDMNSNASHEASEPGLNGWMIKVYKDVNGDGLLDGGDSSVSSALTAGGGLYSFSLTPGKYIVCEVGQTNWTQTAPSGSVCAADPFNEGLAGGGYSTTLTSGQLDSGNDFGNTPLSNISVNFYDLTGSTNATISCVAAGNSPVGSSSTDESASPETTLTANALKIGTYTCTVVITDP